MFYLILRYSEKGPFTKFLLLKFTDTSYQCTDVIKFGKT